MSPGNQSPRALDRARRRVLQGLGLGGISLALPPLEAFMDGAAGKAYAEAANAKKLVLFHFGNGAPMDYWRSLALPREGVGKMMAKSTVVHGLSISPLVNPLHDAGVNGHAAGCMCMLTCVPALPDPGQEQAYSYKGGGESFDQVANRFINRGRPVRLWAAQTHFDIPKQGYLSYTKSGGLLPLVTTNETLEAFSGITPDTMPVDNSRYLRRQRVTTAVKRQVDVLKRRLGSADQARMDGYLSSLSQLEATLKPGAQQKPTCVLPKIDQQTSEDGYSMQHVHNMFELVHRALQCDITNVMIFSVTRPGEGPSLDFLGASSDAPGANPGSDFDHGPSHWDNETRKEQYRKAQLWKMQRLGEFLSKLDSERGPDGKTVLDQSAVIAFSEMGEGNRHSGDDITTIVSGGAFNRPGEAIDANGPMANLWLTAMRATGISDADVPRFGDSTGTIGQLLK